MFEENGIFMHRDRVYVPNAEGTRDMVLKEMHVFPYVGHSGYHKQ